MTRVTLSFSSGARLRAVGLLATIAAPASGQVCFQSDTPLDRRVGGEAVACVDLDLDGHLDVVTVSMQAGPGVLRVYFGQGSGSFSTAVPYLVGLDPRLVRSADLNGDGFPDLVVGNFAWPFVSVFLNQGDGTLAARADYSLSPGDAGSIACADFDGDGDVDLACGDLNSPGSLRILRNHGDGTFSTPAVCLHHGSVLDLAAADLDGDGDMDIVALCPLSSLRIFLNLGGGNFASPLTQYTSVYDPYRLGCADLDGDGDPDLAVLGENGTLAVIEVLSNLGAGAFGNPTLHELGFGLEDAILAVGDLDGDTLPELFTAGRGKLFVVGNHGGGIFTPTEGQTTADYPHAVAAADLDGDGRAEVVVAGNSQLWVMHNVGGWRLAEPPQIPLDRQQVQVLGADLDGDGDADLAVLERSEHQAALGRVEILGNDGHGNFSAFASCVVGRCPASMTATDLDGDGALDLVVANDGDSDPGATGSLSVLVNHGDGTFAPEIRYMLDTYPRVIASADIDRDGSMDVVLLDVGAGSSHLGSISVFLNDGHGALAAPVRYAVGRNPSELQVADLDGDGALDIVALNQGESFFNQDLSILRNQGSGSFAPAVTVAAGLHPRAMQCGDVDADGDVDLVLRADQLIVLLNNGAGVFGAPQSHSMAYGSGPIRLEDLDGDGRLDLIALNDQTNTISVLAGTAGAGFTDAGEWAAGSYPGSLCVADLDGDGDPEIACTSEGGVTLLVNCSKLAAEFCAGDGSAGACPCNNLGASGHGCENSASTGGALLTSNGQASLANDSLSLTCSGELPTSLGVVLQGTLRITPLAFGDGLRCVGGMLTRLYVQGAVGGVLSVPQPGDASISARSAAMGDTISAGSTRLYQVCYRDPDPGFCPAPQGSSWNVSSALALRWAQ